MTPIVGTAGWSLPRSAWPCFPGAGTHLQRYAAVLPGVEINSSFYRPHRRDTYARWAAGVPEHFRFVVKIPKRMTHEQRLLDCDALLDGFAGEVCGLGAKRGPLLVQLPPSLAFEATTAAIFFAGLQERLAGPVVCEPRHASWFSGAAGDLLKERGIARVAADPAPVSSARDPGGSSVFAYFRLHGSPRIYESDYDGARLAAIVRRLRSCTVQGIPAWCIFDNTAAGHAIGNALAVARLLAAQPP